MAFDVGRRFCTSWGIRSARRVRKDVYIKRVRQTDIEHSRDRAQYIDLLSTTKTHKLSHEHTDKQTLYCVLRVDFYLRKDRKTLCGESAGGGWGARQAGRS